MISRYFIRPKADQDLEDQAYYLATQASPEVGHRFLVAAHETFKLLATQPGIWLAATTKSSQVDFFASLSSVWL